MHIISPCSYGHVLTLMRLFLTNHSITTASSIVSHRSWLENEGRSTAEERYMQYMQVLLTDIAVVHSFIEELDPGFVVCHDFERMGDVEQSVAVSDFLAPNEAIADLLSSSFVNVSGALRPPSNESLPYEAADTVATRLQSKFDTLESKYVLA